MYTNDIEDVNYEDEQTDQGGSNGSGNSLKLLIIVILAIVAIGLIIFAVSKKKGTSSANDTYTISIYPETIVVPIGETKSISYEVKKNNEIIQNASVRLKSGDENIVTVDNYSLKGINYGKTALTIVFTSEDGKTIQDIKEVSVAKGDPTVKIEKVSFPEGDLQMPLNGTYDIAVGVVPENGYIENMRFTSANSSVATVDNLGKVTAVGEGETTITIDVNNGTFRKVLKVFVNDKSEISSIVVSPTKITVKASVTSMKEGDVTTLTYTTEPENAVANVTWSSSDESVATVDASGQVKAIKEGTAIIKATTSNGLVDSVKIQVSKASVDVTDITLSQTELSIEVGGSSKIVPTIVPEDATDKTLTYESSNTGVAAVSVNSDMSADVTGVTAGSATITIKSSNGIEKKVNVTVSEAPTETAPPSGGDPPSGGSCSKKCDAGKYLSSCSCKECPANSYCTGNKKYDCPAGSTSAAGSKAKSDCKSVCSGGWGYDTTTQKCRRCAAGYYSPAGDPECHKCSSGYTSTAGSTYCKRSTCPAGQGVDPSATTGCSNCAKGYYSPANDGTCHACPSGYTTKTSGATSSSACVRSTTVVECPGGQYKTSSGTCVNCPSGYTSTKGVATSASMCYKFVDSGKYLRAYSSTVSSCAAGSYSSAKTVQYGKSSTCTQCPAGTIAPSSGSSSCTKCASGKSNAARTACIS